MSVDMDTIEIDTNTPVVRTGKKAKRDDEDREDIWVVYFFKNRPELSDITTNEFKNFQETLKLYKENSGLLELRSKSGDFHGGQGYGVYMEGEWKSVSNGMDSLFHENTLGLPDYVLAPKGKMGLLMMNLLSFGRFTNPSVRPYGKMLEMWDEAGKEITKWDLDHGTAVKGSYYRF